MQAALKMIAELKIASKKALCILVFLAHPIVIFSQADEHISAQERLNEHQPKDSTRVKLLIDVANEFLHTKPSEGFVYANEAIDIASEIDWHQGKIRALQLKGTLYYVLNDIVNAMEAYQNALKICKTINDELTEAKLYNNLGNIYADTDQNKKALDNYHSYLRLSRKLKKKKDQVVALSNIAVIYNETERLDEGISYLNEALEISKELGNDYFIAAVLNNLGIAYKRKKEYQKSLYHYESALEIAKKIDNKYIEASALNSIGKVNIILANYDVAMQSALGSLAVSQGNGAVEWQADSWEVISQAHENRNEHPKALQAYKKHIALRDSVINEEKKAEITRKEMQFKMDRQETIANAEIKRQRLIKNSASAAGLFVLLCSIIGSVLYKKKRDATHIAKIAEFNTMVAETELKALRSQMNPHFIFNSLNSIGDYISKNNLAQADEYLSKFAKLTRSILENSEKKWIEIGEDISLTKLYLELESLRLKTKLNYTIRIDEAIDQENTLVPPMLLQPFIENSIWHGIAPKSTNGAIDIHYGIKNEMLFCSVDDDGLGRMKKNNSADEKISLGIKITKNRLTIINKLKNTSGAITIIDKPVGVRVELNIPLELRF